MQKDKIIINECTGKVHSECFVSIQGSDVKSRHCLCVLVFTDSFILLQAPDSKSKKYTVVNLHNVSFGEMIQNKSIPLHHTFELMREVTYHQIIDLMRERYYW